MTNPRLNHLIYGWLDGELTPRDEEELHGYLLSDPEARRQFWRLAGFEACLADAAELIWSDTPLTPADGVADTIPEYPQPSEPANERGGSSTRDSASSPILEFLGLSQNSTNPWSLGGRLFVTAAAGVLLTLALMALGRHDNPGAQPVAAEAPQRSHDGPGAQSPFATLKAVTECVWAPDSPFVGRSQSADASQGISLAPGELLELSRGSVEISIASGTRLFVDAPARLTLVSSARCRLESGKLLAQVSHQAIGFTVSTPTLVVVDLGTEFGVEALHTGESEVHVLLGKVSVAPERNAVANIGKPSAQISILEAGEAIRMLASGESTSIPTDPARFVRPPDIAAADFGGLDVVDLVCGGNGYEHRRGTAVDTQTGQFGQRPWSQRIGDGRYHATPTHRVLDGCFLPNGLSQIDSTGRKFEFPATTNLTWDHIRAGGEIPNTNDGQLPGKLGAIDYSELPHGLLLTHANAGLTLDLAAIRRLAQREIRGFKAVVGNTHAPKDPKADVFVIVDGQVRFERRGFTPIDTPFAVSVPLEATDRFLTLVTTDGGDTFFGDWIAWGDPTLETLEH